MLPAESQQALLERAGGNPLYAEQFAELFLERGSADELGLPETLQGIIAARLDGLADTEKDLLRDAAVIGKVFWASAVRNGSDASTTLHSLERKGFVRRQKRSSVEGETEFAFAHALVRDVAYGQIARADRAEKHRGVAEWIEGLGRPEDHAEMLAHHWQSAFELARARRRGSCRPRRTGSPGASRSGRSRRRTQRLPTAEKYYAEALALWPDADPERPDLLFRRARSLHLAGDDRRTEALEEARDALLAVRRSRARRPRRKPFWHTVPGTEAIAMPPNDTSRARTSLVADRDPSASKARVLALSARARMLAGDHRAGDRRGTGCAGDRRGARSSTSCALTR